MVEGIFVLVVDSITVLFAASSLIYVARLVRLFKGGLFEKPVRLSFVALLLLGAGRVFDLLTTLYGSDEFILIYDIMDLLAIATLSAAMIVLYRNWRKMS